MSGNLIHSETADASAERPVAKRAGDALGWPCPPLGPRWIAWTPQAAILWALAYGAVRVWWAVGGAPSFGRPGFDLIAFRGWGAVGLCAATAAIALALRTARWWRPLLIAAWALCAAHLAACPLLLLDVVGGLLPGMGVSFSTVAFMSRAACLVDGVLLGAVAIAYRRRWRSECMFCGRTHFWIPWTQTPLWARWAAYAAVAGCVARLGAQAAVGFGGMQMKGGGARLAIEAGVFEAAFLFAGTVLPLALVHAWGRVVPRWIPLLAGRRVPRWLLLGPGFAIAGLMTVYFGLTFVKLATDTLRGTAHTGFDPLPLAFFWVAVPAYLVWGIGLGVAAINYYKINRPACDACGRL